MGLLNKTISQAIDGNVSGENRNENAATGVVVFNNGGTGDCYEQGKCNSTSCRRSPAYCPIAARHLPAKKEPEWTPY